MKQINSYSVFRLDGIVLTLLSKHNSRNEAIEAINGYAGGEFIILEVYS